jgi:hypothetical protein
VLLDEIMAEAYSAPYAAKDLLLNAPFQKVVRAWREVASPSEVALSDFLQQHEPPANVYRLDEDPPAGASDRLERDWQMAASGDTSGFA